jgi:BirA family biotin operon repressor/biotin-[acetyl-CoA-carboxylase] ligase|tara:strand:+ start:3545 stop:4291 length:747 start_codon:yes stop_codon:yes gene_type:complete
METLFIGKKYYSFQELPSTNTWLMESLVAHKLPEGTLVLADHQTEGKGQFGAIWSSEPSSSLTFSILLKPIFLPISNTYDISICIALAIHDCLNELRPGFKIKWPNDIYFENKKVAGILIENQIHKSSCEHSVVGIGLNVNQTEFFKLPKATSLKQIIGVNFPIQNLLDRLCETIEARYLQLRANMYPSLLKSYLEHMYWFNEIHTFQTDALQFNASIIGVLRNGRLLLKFSDGSKRDFEIKELQFIA